MCICVYMYICIYVYMYMYIYIYIYRERERYIYAYACMCVCMFCNRTRNIHECIALFVEPPLDPSEWYAGPISLLTSFLLRSADSKLPGNFLWTCESNASRSRSCFSPTLRNPES